MSNPKRLKMVGGSLRCGCVKTPGMWASLVSWTHMCGNKRLFLSSQCVGEAHLKLLRVKAW